MSKGTIVFLAANASYAHTNLAGWYLRGVAAAAGWRWREVELIKSEALPLALQRLMELQPDILAASFYLFNRQFLLALIKRFKALQPPCPVIAGGPEFLGDNFPFLQQSPEINAVIRGEGELAFAEWLAAYARPEKWRKIKGLCAFIGGQYIDNGKAELIKNLDDIPSPFRGNLAGFKKPFLLMETSRGCSNHCAFCTSAGEKTRFFSRPRARRDFSSVAAAGVREIRLADRTFNENPKRCLALLKIMRADFPRVKFHLEIDPARVGDELLQEFSRSAAGQLQLEVGIQTARRATLGALNRAGSRERAFAVLRQLCQMRNISVHADLLAGLPEQTLADVYDDARRLALMQPDEIQLEVLKVLPGTPLGRARERWGILAAPEPPYEVLRTAAMDSGAIVKAHGLSNLMDWFYNGPELQPIIIAAVKRIPDFFEHFNEFCAAGAQGHPAPALENRFRLLAQFCRRQEPGLAPKIGYAWLKAGLSAQHGLYPAAPWKAPVPKEAVLIEGNACAGRRRIYLATLERPYLFVYEHPGRRAAAIYAL